MLQTELPLLLKVDDLRQAMDSGRELLIIDVTNAENFNKGHIPSAQQLEPAALQGGVKPAVGKLPSENQLSALFSSLGLRANSHVVAYDDEGGGWAGRLIWTLDAIGHKNYSYLDGGIHAWRASQMPIETDAPASLKSDYTVTIDPNPIAELEEVLASIGNSSVVIWDARSAQEYSGEKVLAARSGHIPEAINIDWLELIDKNNEMRLVNLRALQNRLNKIGLSATKTIITHCQTHHRSGLTYLVMKLLDYPSIKGYHGSWSEWGNREDTPIEL